MKIMETIQDLIEEAKLRTVYWALSIFAVSYFLTHTSNSMWMNIPIAVLMVSGLRILCNEVDFRWKVHIVRAQTYLSFLEKKQLSVNDYRLSTAPPPPKWKRKIDSPLVQAAMRDFIDKLLHDFVEDLWYSDITPDKEAPDLIRAIIMDVLGEISGRLKQVNLVDLLTRDVVDLVGDHLDLFRRNQAAIGMEVMGTLSFEERDERLKHHLLASKELHPALISPECEYKVLQRLMGGLLAIVLRPREAQSPLVRCIARELLTCLVMQPLMNFASPGYINELIEYIFLANKDEGSKDVDADGSPDVDAPIPDHASAAEHVEGSRKNACSRNQSSDTALFPSDNLKKLSSDASGSSVSKAIQDDSIQSRPADWARVLEAATQRRTEVLTPENLENMWAIGRNYKRKLQKNAAPGLQSPIEKSSVNSEVPSKDLGKEVPTGKAETSITLDNKALVPLPPRAYLDTTSDAITKPGPPLVDQLEDKRAFISNENKKLKRSNSTSDLAIQLKAEDIFAGKAGGPFISEFYGKDFSKRNDIYGSRNASDMVFRSEAQHGPKLRCRVIGAYFEKLGSKSFAVYSIAVTDADNSTWFVKRRYRNFERLHRQLKDIPNYTLHLPPKRIFSSSTEDAFVHQRCIQLDKYLQDLLSIANVAEQHEVWDFLSVSSKNYSFGKSSSVMRTLAVNVDDAVDDIVRQFKGVSDGFMRKVVGSPPSSFEATTSAPGRNLSWNADEMNKLALTHSISESLNSFSDNEEGDKDGNHGQEESANTGQASGWHSDNELNSKGFPPRVVKRDEESRSPNSENRDGSGTQLESLSPETSLMLKSEYLEDPMVPPEWTPPNLSVPILNLVDNIFQLKRRGWLRRQVFWISKQILQLMMEDAIDDWLLRQIHFLRREDVIAHGIRWIQDVLWPGGTFFLKLRAANDSQLNQGSVPTKRQMAGSRASTPGSFQEQLEAARRASDVKKMIFNGAPTTLVSLIGHKQYRRCAKDIYYFLQSTTCLKQLAYGILELLLISIFPELRDLIMDIHEKMRTQPV